MQTVTNVGLNMERPMKKYEQWTRVLPSSTNTCVLPVMDYHQIIDHMHPYAIKIISIIPYLWLSEIYHPKPTPLSPFLPASRVRTCSHSSQKKKCDSLCFPIKDCFVQLEKEILVLQSFDFGIGYLGSNEAYYHRKLDGHLLLHV